VAGGTPAEGDGIMITTMIIKTRMVVEAVVVEAVVVVAAVAGHPADYSITASYA
jgi:hypothetical protein